jgi:desulfoferrodoxin (superoxide reductase-like protein)
MLPAVDIRPTEFGEALHNVDFVPAGELVLRFDLDSEEHAPHIHRIPTRYSVQVGVDIHLDTPKAHFQWLQHQKDAALRVDTSENSLRFYALRDLEAGTMLSFDYNTNEWDMATPFVCGFTAASICGFRGLAPEEQRRLAEMQPCVLAPHIVELYKEDLLQRDKRAQQADRLSEVKQQWQEERAKIAVIEAAGIHGGPEVWYG